MWTPDVYEGAPTPVTAMFAIAPKVAAMALLVRLMMSAFGPLAHQWQIVISGHFRHVDGARRLRRDRPAQHQAPDGL